MQKRSLLHGDRKIRRKKAVWKITLTVSGQAWSVISIKQDGSAGSQQEQTSFRERIMRVISTGLSGNGNGYAAIKSIRQLRHRRIWKHSEQKF